MAQLGDVFLNTVYEEKVDNRINSTDHPVEEGVNIVDHVEREPLILSISGIVTGEDASARKLKLQQYANNGTILNYRYRNKVDNVIIESFQTTHPKSIKGGFSFDITLKQIRVAKPSLLTDLSKELRVQIAMVGNAGRVQTQ